MQRDTSVGDHQSALQVGVGGIMRRGVGETTRNSTDLFLLTCIHARASAFARLLTSAL